ncbi:hypothetical protein, conserved [Angomonas deanei]|uniref:Uncharacterized protein n=1 Tax=Angomonas deanei TaxID=59799 RepID=A0A7G2CL49_9TRYP|nr:hypothetical protein, conserved [Angomonas deanei]
MSSVSRFHSHSPTPIKDLAQEFALDREASLPVVATRVKELGDIVEKLSKRCQYLEKVQDRQRVITEDLRNHIAKLEEHFAKSSTELTYAQQQLEFVVISQEREHGVVADHTEQLRLFAGEAGRYGANSAKAEAKPFILILANWLYTPVVQFVKGIYTLFFPFINTTQSLSLFNSGVLQRYTASQTRARWEQMRKGDLLEMLQTGTLDPTVHNGSMKPSIS